MDTKLAEQPLGLCHNGQYHQQKKVLKQVVPQGPVISPLLFIIYTYDITENITGVADSLFADNVALYCTHNDLKVAEERIKHALTVVADWSNKWKLTISVPKCEASFFTTYTQESTWRPNLKIGSEVIPYNKNPKFLGVTYDQQLTFKDHAKKWPTAQKRNRERLST